MLKQYENYLTRLFLKNIFTILIVFIFLSILKIKKMNFIIQLF